MGFPDSFVDEVRRAADVVRVISEHVALKKTGSSWKGLCPFHKEKTPSFNVRSEPPLFHCFGCGEGGDVFKFLMLHERVSFPEAVVSLARRHGVPVPEDRYEPGPDRKLKDEILIILEAAARHFEKNLWTARGTRVREYLLGRGFQKQTLERIRAGAAPDAWDDLLGALRGQFTPASLMAAGLVLPRKEKNGHYDRFRNRAVFPILNEAGKVVGFGARCLDGSEPKYLNSPETPVYQKGRTLYGMSWAKSSIREREQVVLMEGYLDVARAIECSVGEAVATCGTALTQSHARLLRRFGQRVLMNFDQDEAGRNAARKSSDLLVAEGLEVRVVELPEGHDPDSYLKASGAEAYRERMAEAPPFMDWLMRRAAAEHDIETPAGKGAYLKAMLPALTRIESAVERAAWLPRIAQAGGLDEAAAWEELRRATGSAPRPRPAPALRRTSSGLRTAEKWFLVLIMRGAEGVETALGELEDAEVCHLHSAPVLRAAKTLYLRAEAVTAAALTAAVTSDEDRRLVTELAVADHPTEHVTPADCVREIKCWPLEARVTEIQERLATAPEAELDALLGEKLRLKQRISNLSRSTLASC
jgi:DNA primase